MENSALIKIAIVGPESTGKSALAQSLATHFKTDWVHEVARDFLEKLNRSYTALDIEEIARLQLEMEDEKASSANGILFCDTTLLVIKIWMENAFKKSPDWILNSIQSRKYDFYLLTDIDLEWLPDPLREHPHKRQFFKDWYETELVAMNTNWGLVQGFGEARTVNALSILEKRLKIKPLTISENP